MSEKRFRANFDVSIYDSEKEEYISVSERGLEEIAKRMNRQQDTINKLNDENAKLLSERIKDCEEFEECANKAQSLKKENEALKKFIKDNFDKMMDSKICKTKNGKISKQKTVKSNQSEDLKKENEQLMDYIDTIFEGNTHICNELDIEDVQFYCERNKDYRSPSCLYQKCFNEENLIGLTEKIKGVFDE